VGDSIDGFSNIIRRFGPRADIVTGENHQVGLLVIKDGLHEANGPGVDILIVLSIREMHDREGPIQAEPQGWVGQPGFGPIRRHGRATLPRTPTS
jgi:hypothetical protein